MIKEPIQRDLIQLQQDEPTDQIKLTSSEDTVQPKLKRRPPVDETTKPFFLYPRDGLYGLL